MEGAGGDDMIVAVMPAYNEEDRIADVIRKAMKYVDRIVVVDDCSSDRTGKIARELGCTVIRHRRNMGLGKSLRDGFEAALKMGADIVITIDADGQHDPSDIPKFIREINRGRDFVLGERDLSRYPLVKRIGNFFLTLLTDFISGTTLRDTESGFRAFRAEALKKLNLLAERYEIAGEIVLEVGLRGLSYSNVPVKSPRYHKGKGVSVLDGFHNFYYLLRRRKRDWKAYLRDGLFVIGNWFRKIRDWLGIRWLV